VPTYTTDDGATLHYDVLGDASARPVIALAGGAARHPAYLGDLGGLSKRWRLCVPHLRGVGRSAAPTDPERGSFWRQAADVDRLREHLGLERCLVAGHSAGTRVAISYAAQFPHRLAGLVLVTPPAAYLVDVPSDAEQVLEARRGEPAFDAAEVAVEVGPDTSNEETFNEWQHAIPPAAYAKWGEAERAHDAAGGPWSMAAARAFFSVDPPQDLPDRLRDVAAPVLVIAGAQDRMTGVAPVTAVADLFSAGRAVTIDQSGHYPWVEQPAAFRQAVEPFLELAAAQERPHG
jgi:pimeloyl-ACP methyl ester carboxylesterase